ncbi:MAG: DUF3990 domain-containing protein [Bacilli bacterium]|nr:DUF3990 domain-containing protein [Bacilli bacterium]
MLKFGKLTNDYGQGFYCTQDKELAKEWALKNGGCGYVNQYEFNFDKLNVLNLTEIKCQTLHWIAILLKYRTFRKDMQSKKISEYIIKHFSIDLSEYDVVIGYRADDSYFSYAQAFISNSLSLNGLSYALKQGNLGLQVALISEKAFSQIKFINSEEVDDSYYVKFIQRDENARKAFSDYMKTHEFIDDIYIMDIIRNEITEDDPRLQ